MPFVDKSLHCLDCGREFVFTAAEQELFAMKGLSEPVRCQGCQRARDSSATSKPATT